MNNDGVCNGRKGQRGGEKSNISPDSPEYTNTDGNASVVSSNQSVPGSQASFTGMPRECHVLGSIRSKDSQAGQRAMRNLRNEVQENSHYCNPFLDFESN
jgi:hypothetical protein